VQLEAKAIDGGLFMEDTGNKELDNQDEPKKAGDTENSAKKSGGRIQKLKAEFKRIIWPDKNTVIKETTAVVVVTVILGIIIAVLDLIIKTGLDKILQIG